MARLGLLRKYTVPFGISLEQQIRVIQSIKPTVLEGYASRLSEVARETIRKGIRDLRPKLVVSNSEQLNSDSRSKIRKAFGVEPVNVYDSWEFGIVAWECPKHEGLHVNEDLLKVEIVKDDGTPAGPGEEGELVITDLFNKAMPLIRYGTGDIAVRKETPCTCGRTFFLLNGISGRESERCIFSDGTYAMATTALNWIISHEPQCSEIIEYQGVQNRKGELDLVLVTKEGFSKDNEKYLRNCILKSFPLKRVKVSYVNRIVRTSAGKFKPFVSNVRCP
jgi:phenylacetate-CoA ligase